VRFQLDEHVPNAVAVGARQRGVDVVTAAEAGIRGADDPVVLARAHADQRIFVTFDDDYLALDREGQPHSGIIYCPLDSRDIGNIVDWIAALHEAATADELVGRIVYI